MKVNIQVPKCICRYEAGGSGDEGQLGLHHEFEANLGYVRPCLKERRKKTINCEV